MRYWFVRRSDAWVVPEAEICVLLSPANPTPELDSQLRTCRDLYSTLISPIGTCAHVLLVCAASICSVQAGRVVAVRPDRPASGWAESDARLGASRDRFAGLMNIRATCACSICVCGEQLLREGVVSRCGQTGPSCKWLCRADGRPGSTPCPTTPSIAKLSPHLLLLGSTACTAC